MPPEQRIAVGGVGDAGALLQQLALVTRSLLEGTASEAEREAARRLVDRVLPPAPPPARSGPGERRPELSSADVAKRLVLLPDLTNGSSRNTSSFS